MECNTIRCDVAGVTIATHQKSAVFLPRPCDTLLYLANLFPRCLPYQCACATPCALSRASAPNRLFARLHPNRMCRNSHPVQPDPLSVDASTVQAFFPCAALVNHSCEPNSFFHATANPSANGSGLEYVLRTTRNVAAGQELCSSYICRHGGVGVLVSVWGEHLDGGGGGGGGWAMQCVY